MKTLKVFLLLAICLAFVAPAAYSAKSDQARKDRKTVYNKTHNCVMVCPGERSALETLETGLAYLLDIPLAIVSPITCPIVAPLMEKYDSGPDRTYCKPNRKN